MMLSGADLVAIVLTVKLAAVVTVLLLLVGTPLAWWLARTRSRLQVVVGALVTLPLVLPPAVLGFYLLVLLGPEGPGGQLTQALGIGLLPFTFAGLVLMIGGNIPGKTQVLSMAIFNHVEAMEYANAHWLAGGLLVFSLGVLLVLHAQGWRRRS